MFTLLVCNFAFGEDKVAAGKFDQEGYTSSYYVFNEDGTGSYYDEYLNFAEIKFKYSLEINNKLIFYNILTDNLKNDQNKIVKRIMVVRDKDCKFYIGYENDQRKKIFYYTKKDDVWAYCEFVEASSFLVENKKSYAGRNMSVFESNLPWVEGVPGDGIGEYFILTRESHTSYWGKPKYLLFLNGYISFEKPYLYSQNNRIRKIKIEGVKTGKTKVFELKDTPQPQTIDISFTDESEDIKATIMEVYKGSKYDDTCLDICRFWYNELIPVLE